MGKARGNPNPSPLTLTQAQTPTPAPFLTATPTSTPTPTLTQPQPLPNPNPNPNPYPTLPRPHPSRVGWVTSTGWLRSMRAHVWPFRPSQSRPHPTPAAHSHAPRPRRPPRRLSRPPRRPPRRPPCGPPRWPPRRRLGWHPTTTVSTTTMRSYRPWERWEIYSSAMGGLSCEILGDACSSTWQQQSIEYRAALWHPQRHTESGGAASQGESAAHWAAWSRRAVERLRRLSRLSFIGPCMTVWCFCVHWLTSLSPV